MRQLMVRRSVIARRIGMFSSILFLGSALSFSPQGWAQTRTFTTIDPSGSIATWVNGIGGATGTGSGSGSGTSTGSGGRCTKGAAWWWDDKRREHRDCKEDRDDHGNRVHDGDDSRSGGAGPATGVSAAPATSGSVLIVGYYYNAGWVSYLDPGGTFSTVTVSGATATFATGVNASGQVVGYYYAGSNTHGFLLSGGNATTLDFPGASQPYGTIATGVNNSGQVVGYFADSASAVHGFLWSGGKFSQIDYPGAVGTYPTGINSAGLIVGYYTDATDAYRHGWQRSGTTMTAIAVSGALETVPQGINTSGQIVGSYLTASGQTSGFELAGTTLTTINVPSAISTVVDGIDDAGEIVGEYTDATMTQHGFSSP